jgi:hypothetical protein
LIRRRKERFQNREFIRSIISTEHCSTSSRGFFSGAGSLFLILSSFLPPCRYKVFRQANHYKSSPSAVGTKTYGFSLGRMLNV